MLKDTIKVVLATSISITTISVLLILGVVNGKEDKKPKVNYVKVRDYSRLTLEACHTDEECEIATAIKFYQDYGWTDEVESKSMLILEPQPCEVGDKECEENNRKMAGKPASYPALCEPYIFSK